MTYCVAHWWGPLFCAPGVPGEPYLPFTPDILLQDDASIDLGRYGIDGLARHTPGHTAGSVSVELSSGDASGRRPACLGCLYRRIYTYGRAMRPPFEDDPQAVSGELMGTWSRECNASTWVTVVRWPPKKCAGTHSHCEPEPGRKYGMQAIGCACSSPS